jgi:outer membrane protein TolC
MNDVMRLLGLGLCACLALVPPALEAQTLAGDTARAAAGPRPLTPEESVRLGLASSPRVRAADADAAAARAVSREARAALLPAVRTQASYTRLGGEIPEAEFTLPGLDTTFTLLPIERDRYHAEIGVQQPLFAGGRLRNRVRAAEGEATAAERLADQERADLAFDVRRAYWSLYGASMVVRATEVAQAQVEEHLRVVRRRLEEGTAIRSELLAAQTRVSEVALERLEAANAVRAARLELNRLIGLPLGEEVQPVPAVAVEPLAGDAGGLAERAAAAQPRLQAMAEQVGALRAQLGAAEGSRLPELAFVSRYVYARPNPYAFTDQATFRGTWEAGLALQWSAWEGGARAARAGQARERLRGAEARLEHAREQVAVEAMRRFLEAQRSTEAVAVAAENVAQAEEALRVTRVQYDEGFALSAQVLEAERAYRAAQARHARALAEYAIGRAALLHAAGEVW